MNYIDVLKLMKQAAASPIPEPTPEYISSIGTREGNMRDSIRRNQLLQERAKRQKADAEMAEMVSLNKQRARQTSRYLNNPAAQQAKLNEQKRIAAAKNKYNPTNYDNGYQAYQPLAQPKPKANPTGQLVDRDGIVWRIENGNMVQVHGTNPVAETRVAKRNAQNAAKAQSAVAQTQQRQPAYTTRVQPQRTVAQTQSTRQSMPLTFSTGPGRNIGPGKSIGAVRSGGSRRS